MADLGGQSGFNAAIADHGAAQWADALLAAEIMKVGGRLVGGLWIKARSGGVREAYLEHLAALLSPARPWTRLPSGVPLSSLTGSLDLAASAASGRLVLQRGLLAAADGGVLLIPMAERLDPACAAVIAEAMDRPSGRADTSPGFLTIAIDESVETDECLPSVLADRLGVHVDLGSVAWSQAARARPTTGAHPVDLDNILLDDTIFGLLSAIAQAGGKSSLRVLGHLSRVARILAHLDQRSAVTQADALTALRLCLGIQIAPRPPEEQPTAENQPEPERSEQQQDRSPPPPSPPESEMPPPDDSQKQVLPIDALTEMLAAIEAGSIAGMADLVSTGQVRASNGRAGKAGAMQKDSRRGRPFGISQSPPFPDARPDLVATLRAGAPWQLIRRRQREQMRAGATVPPETDVHTPRALIKPSDYRYQRLRHQAPSTAIFMVDASGSTALERLGETKGAIEQLLAKCYVRRDEVALIAFRGLAAEVIVEPTRSLVMAKRKLSGLPGGGPTPLVSGLQKGMEMAMAVRRRGSTPVLVLMTDGSGNIALDGTADRAVAARELQQMATRCRGLGLRSICIDIARRPREAVTNLAAALGADLHVLARADARRMSDLVNVAMEETRA